MGFLHPTVGGGFGGAPCVRSDVVGRWHGSLYGYMGTQNGTVGQSCRQPWEACVYPEFALSIGSKSRVRELHAQIRAQVAQNLKAGIDVQHRKAE